MNDVRAVEGDTLFLSLSQCRCAGCLCRWILEAQNRALMHSEKTGISKREKNACVAAWDGFAG